ncbi:MAG: DUF411 domain-containing protein [Acidobacteria bacterium]|nr:DUF411 domain-containing protein [Acidobacteriota bacterium]
MRTRALVTAFIVLVGWLFVVGTAVPQSLPLVEVYKSPTCGCCSKWVEHLRQNGFPVKTTLLNDAQLAAFKTEHGVPPQVQSCHTALVDRYVIEGHVPAVDIRRLLKERPAVAGLAVAGMQRGSPGMEVFGAPLQNYSVLAFDKKGTVSVFATRRG